jgi:branched-chain amino acid transport system ATP-binding protein
MTQGAALRVENLTLRFGGVTAIDDLSFSVAPGELIGLIGPNGAGKTSIFNCLSGAYTPTSGRILLDDVDITGMRPYKRADMGLARTFQNLALYSELSVIDNLLLGAQVELSGSLVRAGLRLRGTRREERLLRARAEEVADALGLSGYLRGRVGQMPYGVRKRLDLGRILLRRPRLVLLDEPLVGMSLTEKRDLVGRIVDMHHELAPTIVVVEHDVSVVMEITQRILVVNFGALLAEGSAAEIQRDPQVIDAYLGRGAATATKGAAHVHGGEPEDVRAGRAAGE